jgi:CO/xanthine dehydrogenase FAD-binding subunit
LNHFEYITPETLEAAAREFLAGEDMTLIAGGTDLIPLLKSRARKPARLLSLQRVRELQGLTMREDGFFIGSMVTLAAVIESPIVGQQIPALTESARVVASPQIRNQGTVGGNLLQERRCHYFNQSESWRANIRACFALGGDICHQIPGSKVCRAIYYSDLAPVLLAFDAAAEILTKSGSKTLSIQEVIHSRTTGKNGKFILKGILIPRLPPGTRGKFLKAAVRSAVDFALADVAVRYSPGGAPAEKPRIRIVLGALSPEPFFLDETARELAKLGSGLLREKVVETALKEAESKISPIRETAVSPGTKKQSLQILRRAMQELFSVLPS